MQKTSLTKGRNLAKNILRRKQKNDSMMINNVGIFIQK